MSGDAWGFILQLVSGVLLLGLGTWVKELKDGTKTLQASIDRLYKMNGDLSGQLHDMRLEIQKEFVTQADYDRDTEINRKRLHDIADRAARGDAALELVKSWKVAPNGHAD